MQRDMQWDVTCCPVTSASLLAILCLAYSIAMHSLQGRNTMTSQPIRDQVEDHLITPKNAALIIIDYQPPQVSSIVSMDHRTLVANIVATARLAKVFALPIVLSTVNVKTGRSAPTIHQLAEVLAKQVALALGNLKLKESLKNQSICDPLTGLFNRRYMEESLEREFSRAFTIGARMITRRGQVSSADYDRTPRGSFACREAAARSVLYWHTGIVARSQGRRPPVPSNWRPVAPSGPAGDVTDP